MRALREAMSFKARGIGGGHGRPMVARRSEKELTVPKTPACFRAPVTASVSGAVPAEMVASSAALVPALNAAKGSGGVDYGESY